jgi:ferredoxin-thioredoxin reductase catalytic subunit
MNLEWYEKYAQMMGLQIGEHANIILEGLELNKSLYGYRYCPCSLIRTTDTICPCKNMKENRECHCGLFKFLVTK